MYEELTLKQTLDYKYARNSRTKEYFKIKSIISLNLVRGHFFVLILKRLYELVKEIFVLDIEQG